MATFKKKANFIRATFKKKANFWQAIFSGEANVLKQAIFSGEANFENLQEKLILANVSEY